MEIKQSARKHKVLDEDMRHAVRNFIAIGFYDADAAFTMIVGPSRTGSLVEIGVLDLDADDALIIHAMPCREKFMPHSQ